MIRHVGQHNHDKPVRLLDQLELRADIRKASLQSEESPSAVVMRCMQKLPLASAANLPLISIITRSVRRLRQTGVAESEISMIEKTLEGEIFVREHSEDLILMTADADLEQLARSDHWFADGTFRVAPKSYESCIQCVR